MTPSNPNPADGQAADDGAEGDRKWDPRQEGYVLYEVDIGMLVYAYIRDGRPYHWICHPCAEHGIKSIMQCVERNARHLHFKGSHCQHQFLYRITKRKKSA